MSKRKDHCFCRDGRTSSRSSCECSRNIVVVVMVVVAVITEVVLVTVVTVVVVIVVVAVVEGTVELSS